MAIPLSGSRMVESCSGVYQVEEGVAQRVGLKDALWSRPTIDSSLSLLYIFCVTIYANVVSASFNCS